MRRTRPGDPVPGRRLVVATLPGAGATVGEAAAGEAAGERRHVAFDALEPPAPPRVVRLLGLTERFDSLPADAEAVKAYVRAPA